MTNWWRAPLIAAAISTIACLLLDVSHRRTVASFDAQIASLQREWKSNPLSKTVDREMDIAAMLRVRKDSIEFVKKKQPSTYATLAAILPPSPMPQLAIGAAGTHFQIVGPAAQKPATDAYLAAAKGITVLRSGTQGQEFVIQGERK